MTYDLDELERLANAATKAPWFKREETCEAGPLTDQHIASVGSNATSADLNFVCAARSAVPELIAEVRRLRAVDERLRQVSFLEQYEQMKYERDGFRADRNAAQAELAALRRVSEIASGILGMDAEDRITQTKVHFADGSTRYIQDALADAIEAAQAAKGGTR